MLETNPPTKYRTILLFGMPGSGKGTQGAILGQLPGLVHISCGDIFRKLPKYGALGSEVIRYTSQGRMVPDELTVRIWKRYMKTLEMQELLLPEHHVVVLDGLPRSSSQAERLDDLLDVIQIFHLKIKDMQRATERLRARALRENRLDDMSEEVIRRRFDIYNKETYQTLQYYPDRLITDIDASHSPLHVLQQVVNRLVELEAVEGEFSLFDPGTPVTPSLSETSG